MLKLERWAVLPLSSSLPSPEERAIAMSTRSILAVLLSLATSSALVMPVTPRRTLARQRAGTVQLIDEPQLVDEPSPDAEATEPAAASPATGDDEPETVVLEFNMGFGGDKSSPIWQKPKYDASNDKETPAALKLVLDFLCKWLVLELRAGGIVAGGGACSLADLTIALRPDRGAFRPHCCSESWRRGLATHTHSSNTPRRPASFEMPLKRQSVLFLSH